MEVHFLDVGNTKYGDCILITHDGKSILVDGGHPGDSPIILRQLKKILKKNPPYVIDLLIVTHCHSDHIGCLPALIKMGDIEPQYALLADPEYGFAEQGFSMEDRATHLADSPRATFFSLLAEEDHTDMNNEELELFIEDVAKLSDKYREMYESLPNVSFFRGVDKMDGSIENKFADFGLKIIGPTHEHLIICKNLLEQSADAAISEDSPMFSDELDRSKMMEAYRSIVGKIKEDAFVAGLEDRPGPGAAKNNQSIVFSVGDNTKGAKTLLAGDMQLAKAEVSGLNTDMDSLIESIFQLIPFDVVKLSHHTSYNGISEALFSRWIENQTTLFIHTGGKNDATHPDTKVLQFLKKQNRKINFLRTDRNGLISIIPKAGGQLEVLPAKGRPNDFTPNIPDDTITEQVQPANKISEAPPGGSIGSSALTTVSEKNGGPATNEISASDSFVEVKAKIPHSSTRVTITIDIDPEKKKSEKAVVDYPPLPPATSDRFNKLLFVTSSKGLAKNIGESEAGNVINLIKDNFRAPLVDLPYPTTIQEAVVLVQQRIRDCKGIVLVGGYDIVPSEPLDVLTPKQRKNIELEGYKIKDSDNFIVWSDDCYADLDNDSLPEYPISRIPDGKDAALIFNSLNASLSNPESKFGIRNVARPFAKQVFDSIPGFSKDFKVSETAISEHLDQEMAKGAVYLMLHGSDFDGTKFWGEEENGYLLEAINIEKIPKNTAGSVIFTGSCWGH